MKAWEAATVGKQGSENSQGETVRTLYFLLLSVSYSLAFYFCLVREIECFLNSFIDKCIQSTLYQMLGQIQKKAIPSLS